MLKKYLIVFFISMVPLVELRGAIPTAIAMGLPFIPSYVVAIIGNMIPVPVIYFFARKVLEWGKDKKVIGKFFTFCLEKGEKGWNRRQGEGFSLHWHFLSGYLFRVQEHGQGHLQHQYLI